MRQLIKKTAIAACVIAAAGINVFAASDEDIYGWFQGIGYMGSSQNTTKIYYDTDSKNIYLKTVKGAKRGDKGTYYDIWLYALDSDGIAKEQARLGYFCYDTFESDEFMRGYYNDFKKLSPEEFGEQYSAYDNQYQEVDAEIGMIDLRIGNDYSAVNSITVTIGETAQLPSKYLLNEGDTVKTEWKLSDNNIIDIDENGNVTGKQTGTCIVSLYLEGIDECFAEYPVEVL